MKSAARTLFEELEYCTDGAITLNVGAPGPSTLLKCAELMKLATEKRLDQELQGDGSLLQYGPPQGESVYITQLARFLSAEYGDQVNENHLVTSAGATNGLHVLMSILFPLRCVVFVEELSYHLALKMFADDLKFPLIAVDMDNDGLNVEDLREKLVSAKKQYANEYPIPDHGYWSVLYCIPIFHNPTGRCLSESKARQLVQLAREYRLLIITEDVYDLLYYDGLKPPKRLFAYDRERAKAQGDVNDGCVISNGTFSKLLAPGLRVGWLELPPWAFKIWNQSTILFSGGTLNMYTAGIVGKALEMGLVAQFVKYLREEYKKRRDKMVHVFQTQLPSSCRVEIPKGGYFIWIQLAENLKASEVFRIAKEKYRILVHEGTKFCLPHLAQKYDRCIRVAISYHEIDDLVNAAEKLSQVISDCVKG